MPETFRKLKKCKSLKEIDETLSADFYAKGTFVMIILMLLMLVREIIHRTYSGKSNNVRDMIAYFDIVGYVIVVFAVIMVIIRCAGAGRKGIKKYFSENKQDILFLLMFVYAFMATILSPERERAFVGEVYRDNGFRTFMVYAAIYICCKNISYKSKGDLNTIKKYVHFAFMLVCTIQNCPVVTVHLGGSGSATGAFYNMNHAVYFMTICIFASLGYISMEKKVLLKLVGMLCYIINVWCLIINNSFGGYIAVMLGMVFMAVISILRHKKISMDILLYIVIFAAVSFLVDRNTDIISYNFGITTQDVKNISEDSEGSEMAGSGRWELWQAAVRYIKANPLLGCGLDCMSGKYINSGGEIRTSFQMHEEWEYKEFKPLSVTHNEYLQYAVEIGAPAAVCYIAGLFMIFIKRIKTIGKVDESVIYDGTAVFSYCVSAFFGVTIFYTSIYFFMFLGMVSAPYTGKEEN